MRCIEKLLKMFTKNPVWVLQGRSRSSMLMNVKKLVTSGCYNKHYRSQITKITSF